MEDWRKLFGDRYHLSFATASFIPDHLASVVHDLTSPLRGGDKDCALARIDRWEKKAVEASNLVSYMISALGMVEILAQRYMRTEDAMEVRARLVARAAREWAVDAYDAIESSRAHIGAARCLVAACGITHAGEEERVAVLETIEAATAALLAMEGMEAMRTSEGTLADVALPRLDSSSCSAAKLVGAEGAAEDATRWGMTSVGDWARDAYHRVVDGALPKIEKAQAALRVGADAIEKASKPAAADIFDALEDATAALSGLLAVNGEAAILLLRCAPQQGFARDRWNASRADAESHGRAALRHLWSATTLVDYTFAGVLAWGSPWQEAQVAMSGAVTFAGKARDAGERLRNAAAADHIHASAVLHQAGSS